MRNNIIILAGLMLFWLTFPTDALASETFVTIVHPVRGRSHWPNRSLEHLVKQVKLSVDYQLATTWLIQYDALLDEEIVTILKKLPKNHEIGLFLEVSEQLATDAFVPYLIGEGSWARPDKVFFSGYTVFERYRMIDRLMRRFEGIFGYYPTSVGALYIDAASLAYLHEKYGISAVLTYADQYSTDNYQKWGKYFGAPYYPSRQNTLVPAQTEKNQLDVVVTQWALRDPVRGYGSSFKESTYSLQANDYLGHHGLNHDYFAALFAVYAETENPVSQVTIGLETGSESGPFFAELVEQINSISNYVNQGKIKAVTMATFASWFRQNIKTNSQFVIESRDMLDSDQWALWWMTPYYRVGLLLQDGKLILRDLKIYDQSITPVDYVFADKRAVLFRTVSSLIDAVVSKNELTLAEGITLITTDKVKDRLYLDMETGKDREEIILDKKKIAKNGEIIFDYDNYIVVPKTLTRLLFQRLTFLFRLVDSGYFPPAILSYSNIDGNSIIGFSLGKDSFIGVGLYPLQFGRFSFPFQTISRFKRIPPKLNIRSWYVSDAHREKDAYLTKIDNSNLSVLPREMLSMAEIESKQRSGIRRIFENELFQVWQLPD